MFFHALKFAGTRMSCLNMRLLGRVLLPRDPASVNAMKQTCVIVIFAFLPDSNQKPTENTAKTLKYQFYYIGFLQTKWHQR